MNGKCEVRAVLLAIVGLVLVHPGRTGAEPPLSQLPTERDSIFRLEGLTSTQYLHFQKNGRYRQIDREHMFTCEMDRGTWKQDTNGCIELQSAVLVKDLESGPLRISTRDVEQLEALRPLEKEIAEFLAANRNDSFAGKDVEVAWKYSYTWSLFESKIVFSAVDVEPETKMVTRKQLEELLEAWKAYLKSDEKNRFRFLPVKYHEFILLASNDYPFLANAGTPTEVCETADHFGGPHNSPAMVFVLVDDDAALKEMKTRQPFIFHPELNSDGEEKLLRYK